jgi:hypothetical protein
VGGRRLHLDSIYGSEELRHGLEARRQAYLFAVASSHALWEQGEQIGAADLVARHPELGWVRWSAGEASQGPRRLPGEFSPWETIYSRFHRWKREGAWEQIRRSLLY